MDRYDILLLLVTEVEKVLVEFKRIQNRVKFNFNIIEQSPDRELLYKYLHASDCMIYNKHSMSIVVVGSSVYGPMGRELIAFAAEDQAREFLRDHRGKKILRFDAVTPELVRSLD